MMQLLLTCILLTLAASTEARGPTPRLIGHYTNMRMSSGPDVHFLSGYNLSLYQVGSKEFGNLAAANGSEEPVGGLLYDIAYNPATKRLHFKSKYSDSREFGKGLPADGRNTRVLMEFTGSITPTRLTGTIQLSNGYLPTAQPVRKRVVLKRTRETYVPQSYAEWIRFKTTLPNW